MSYEYWPEDTWPPYCRGGAYIIQVKMVKDLFLISAKMPYIPQDDVWITGLMRVKLGNGNTNIIVRKVIM